ncbi:hypothetical protein GCM10009119_21830 [Algoriphagus jejuensis]|uniref:Uncharacterized protein n=1 Tax=Algoriphagus jejuensis TaxID=419934 RepID=A0ABP3YCN1_9BACT
MDRILTKFEKLFSIRFSHAAYPNSGSMGGILTPNLLLEPDPTTATFFKKHDIHFRMRADMLLCFVRIKPLEDAPYFRLPNSFSARFFIDLTNPVKANTDTVDTHGKENMYRFRINLRAAANSMSLSGASMGPIVSREATRVFSPGNPGSWTTSSVNLSGHFGVIDIVTEGSSAHRLYTDVNNQHLFYTSANGNENEHLFTIHLNN